MWLIVFMQQAVRKMGVIHYKISWFLPLFLWVAPSINNATLILMILACCLSRRLSIPLSHPFPNPWLQRKFFQLSYNWLRLKNAVNYWWLLFVGCLNLMKYQLCNFCTCSEGTSLHFFLHSRHYWFKNRALINSEQSLKVFWYNPFIQTFS